MTPPLGTRGPALGERGFIDNQEVTEGRQAQRPGVQARQIIVLFLFVITSRLKPGGGRSRVQGFVIASRLKPGGPVGEGGPGTYYLVPRGQFHALLLLSPPGKRFPCLGIVVKEAHTTMSCDILY